MEEDTASLTELMLHAEMLCVALAAEHPKEPKLSSEAAFKINECRAVLSELQSLYDVDQLSVRHALTLATFRRLTQSLMWASYFAGPRMSDKLYRKLVQIESGFTLLLITQLNREAKS